MGMHADVMKANPDTAEAKERLFEALKERGGVRVMFDSCAPAVREATP